MKLYLLVVALVLVHSLGFRVLLKNSIPLTSIPDSISYLKDNLLVVQSGSSIKLYNTTNNAVLQSFTSDTDNPQMQIAADAGMILFKNNRSVFQLQETTQKQNVTTTQNETSWIYGLGNAERTLIAHQMNAKGAYREIVYLDTTTNQQKVFSYENATENVVAGSNIEAISADEYYFASGGVCHNEDDQHQFFFFRGDDEGIQKVYSFNVPGCLYQYLQGHKQQWILSTQDLGNFNRVHALTYTLDEKYQPRTFTTHMITSNGDMMSELSRFDTQRLIGTDMIKGSVYTAQTLTCRVMESSPNNYAGALQWDSVLQGNVTKVTVSPDEEWALAATNSTLNHLLTISEDGAYSIFRSFQTVLGGQRKVEFINNSQLVVMGDSAAETYTIYDIQNDVSQDQIALDFCATPDNHLYTLTQEGSNYVLSIGAISSEGGLHFQILDNMTIPNFSGGSLLCLEGRSVLVNPSAAKQSISIWKWTTTFTNTANLVKLVKVHDKAYRSTDGVYFTNSDYRTTPIFYDLNLQPIFITNSISIGPNLIYQVYPTNSDQIVFGVGDSPSEIEAIDHYQLFGTGLVYMGSYSLQRNGTSQWGRTLIMPNSGKISIDYKGQDSSNVLTYNLTMPPQQLRGYFYDNNTKDCSAYSNALFRINPSNNNQEIVLVNTPDTTPILERYSMSSNNSLQLVGKAVIENFLQSKLTSDWSQDKLSIILYGIKQGSTLADTIQVRNANNMQDVTFEKAYFSEDDHKDIQAYALAYNTVYTDIIYQVEEEHFSELASSPTSGGKVSTDPVIGDISMFATCSTCGFMAAIGTNTSKILLVALKTGATRSTINTNCPVDHLALSYDGSRLAYLCNQGNNLYVYNTALEQLYRQSIPLVGYDTVTFASNNDLVLNWLGNIIHQTISETQIPLENPNQKEATPLRANQNSTVAVSNSAGLYAYSPSPQVVQINDLKGNPVDTFNLNSSQQVVTLAFSPSGLLSMTTNASNLLTLTSSPCPANSIQTNGVCICEQSFQSASSANGSLSCFCAPFMHIEDSQCRCEEGKYFVNNNQCDDCNAMCSTCSDSGVSGCQSYSALFIIIIVASCLIVVGAGVFLFIRWRRQQTKNTVQQDHDEINKSKDKSEQKEPLIHGEADD